MSPSPATARTGVPTSARARHAAGHPARPTAPRASRCPHRHRPGRRQSGQPDLLQPQRATPSAARSRRSRPSRTSRIAPVGTLFDQSENRSRKLGGKFSYERAVPGFEDADRDARLRRAVRQDRAGADRHRPRLGAARPSSAASRRSRRPTSRCSTRSCASPAALRYENVRIKIDDLHHASAFVQARASSSSGGSAGVQRHAAQRRRHRRADRGHPRLRQLCRGLHRPRRRPHHPRDRPPTASTSTTILDISPIVSNNREIGLEVKRGPLDASASYFWSTSDKGQLLVLVGDGSFEVQRQRVEIEGLELNARASARRSTGLTLQAGYAASEGPRPTRNGDGRVDIDLDGANISPDRFNLAANYSAGPISARRADRKFYLSRRLRPARDPRNRFRRLHADRRRSSATRPASARRSAWRSRTCSTSYYIDYNSDTQPADRQRPLLRRPRPHLHLGWDYRF